MRRLGAVLWIAAAVGGTGAAAFGYSPPKAPASQQTHPRVRPASGGLRTTFVLTLHAAQDLGVQNVVQSDYSIVASAPRRSCTRQATAVVRSARKGQQLSVRLTPSSSGWCRGRYSGVVLLERGPYCPKPAPGAAPRPCPEFATQALDVGRFAFRVR